jgi:hypothetical protein
MRWSGPRGEIVGRARAATFHRMAAAFAEIGGVGGRWLIDSHSDGDDKVWVMFNTFK